MFACATELRLHCITHHAYLSQSDYHMRHMHNGHGHLPNASRSFAQCLPTIIYSRLIINTNQMHAIRAFWELIHVIEAEVNRGIASCYLIWVIFILRIKNICLIRGRNFVSEMWTEIYLKIWIYEQYTRGLKTRTYSVILKRYVDCWCYDREVLWILN